MAWWLIYRGEEQILALLSALYAQGLSLPRTLLGGSPVLPPLFLRR